MTIESLWLCSVTLLLVVLSALVSFQDPLATEQRERRKGKLTDAKVTDGQPSSSEDGPNVFQRFTPKLYKTAGK